MSKLIVDFNQICGKIKPMNAVGQPPVWGWSNHEYFHYLQEANIPYSRLHDVEGSFGASVFVDIPNLFRNFESDVNDPKSYDFTFTDLLIKGLMEYNCLPVFRLGVTIENYYKIKAYRIYPPTDFKKWAEICEHVISHYTEGWANGFHYNIQYWEIWNEPDNKEMWLGTMEEFFELYTVAATHLKNVFKDRIKIGGYGSSGFYYALAHQKNSEQKSDLSVPEWYDSDRTKYMIDFMHGFFRYIKDHHAPIDFFSWHSYGGVSDTERMVDYLNGVLIDYGFENIETHLNEWNNANKLEMRNTSYASSNAAAMMIAMQKKKVDMLCYYDARISASRFAGLFNPSTHTPCCTYYSFQAFGELLKLGNMVPCELDGAYALAAKSNEKYAVLIANPTASPLKIESDLNGARLFLIDASHYLTEMNLSPTSFESPSYGTILITG